MPELRQNFFTKEWVIIATEGAKRPEQFIGHRPERPSVAFSANCPFLPGERESDSP
jgi:UDPglucose--hexose-1-phosphate uridylyltransferase